MPWCKFFMPKIAASHLHQHDASVNDKIQYCKCLKGHVLQGESDWVLCEHLPMVDALCWQEGGETEMSLRLKKQHSMDMQNSPEHQPKHKEPPQENTSAI